MSFELQIHTPDSFDAKMLNHEYYEIARADDSTSEQVEEANKQMKQITSTVEIPKGALELTHETAEKKPVVIPVTYDLDPSRKESDAATGRKIGVLGGTYDPITNGHVALGLAAYEQLGLNEVWYMPNANPVHKQDRKVADAEDRCAMVELALKDYPFMKLCRYEVDNSDGGLTLTTYTFGALHKLYPEDTLYFIMGADTLYRMDTWTGLDVLLDSCTLAVAGREVEAATRTLPEQIEYLKQNFGAKIEQISFEETDISSTMVRTKLQNGESVQGLISSGVEDYIWDHELYGTVSEQAAA